MKCTVMGKKKVDFITDTKEHIQSVKLSVLHKYPSNSDVVISEGEACSEVAVPFEYYDSIAIGDKLLLDFDKNGKLLEMELLN